MKEAERGMGLLLGTESTEPATSGVAMAGSKPCPPLTSALSNIPSKPPQQTSFRQQSMEQGVSTASPQLISPAVTSTIPSDRHVRQKVGDSSLALSTVVSPSKLTQTLPMPIGIAPDRRTTPTKTSSKAHSPQNSRSVSPTRARAVRSAIGKAVIGAECDRVPLSSGGTSSQGLPTTASSCHSGPNPTNDSIASGSRFGFIASGTSLSNNSSDSSPLSPASTTSNAVGDAHASPFGTLSVSDQDGGRSDFDQSSSHDARADVCHKPESTNGHATMHCTVSTAGSLTDDGGLPNGPATLCTTIQDSFTTDFQEPEADSRQRTNAFDSCLGFSGNHKSQKESHFMARDLDSASSGVAIGLSQDVCNSDRGGAVCVPDTLPLKRPAPEAETPTMSDSSIVLSIGDHISAARSAFSNGGSISFGLKAHSVSSSADQATSMDRTACLDTAASPLSRTAGIPGPLHGCYYISSAADTQASTDALQSAATPVAVPNQLCDAESPDSTLHSLELARLRLTHDCSVEASSLLSTASAASRDGGGDSSRGSASGNDDIGLQFPSRLALRPFADAGLLSLPLRTAMPRDSKEAGVKSSTKAAPSSHELQQHRPHRQLHGGLLLRTSSDPSGSRANRQMAAALAAHQQLATAPQPALPPRVQTSCERQVSPVSNHSHKREEAGPLCARTSAAADVGASLSRMVLLREGTGCSPFAAQQRLPPADGQSLATSSTIGLGWRNSSSTSVVGDDIFAGSSHSSELFSDPVKVADNTQPLGGTPPDDVSMHMSPRRAQAADERKFGGLNAPDTEPMPPNGAGSCVEMVGGVREAGGCLVQLHRNVATPAFPGSRNETAKQRQAVAALLAARGRSKEALELLEPLLLESPTSPDLLRLRGECLATVGNNVGAFASFASALATDSRHIDTLTSCGRLYKGRGLIIASVESYRRALAIRPDSKDIAQDLAVVLTDRGTQLKLSGSPQSALESYLEAVKVCPSYAPALYNVAVVHAEAGRIEEAITEYHAALAKSPAYPQAWCNLGVIYKNQGRVKEAVQAYEKALAGAPNFTIVRTNLAIALTELATSTKSQGNLLESIKMYDRALGYNPHYPDALYNLGVACGEAGQLDRAFFAYEMAVALNPACAEALNNMGVLHRECGNLEGATHCYTAALQIRPNFPQGLNNLAVVYTAQGRVAEALQLLQGALLAAPDYVEAHNNLGVLHRDIGNVSQAILCYDRCLELCPDTRNAGQNRLLALNYVHPGEDRLVCAAHEEWGSHFQTLFTELPPLPRFSQRSLSSKRLGSNSEDCSQRGNHLKRDSTHVILRTGAEDRNSRSSNGHTGERTTADATALDNSSADAYPANFTQSSSESAILESSVADQRNAGVYCAKASKAVSPPEEASLPSAAPVEWLSQETPRLTVGYLSADLFTHSVSYFAETPLRHHDAATVRLIVYSCVTKGDAKTAKLAALVRAAGGTWRDVAALTEPQLAAAVRKDGVDILVELAGHTANNRLGAVAMRPAPVQVTWIGYPNSTGLQAVDYRITDAVCDPLDSQQTFVEELVRMPGCFLCYTPADDAPEVAACPSATDGFVTFGSFNNLAKITPQVLQLWARILHAVPNSRLLLKNKPYACESARNHTLALLQALGIPRIRVDLLPLAASTVDHLATYSGMDISLDPFPYGGTTTTCESLYMGVPCVTMAGNCHAHNVGVSLLTAIPGLTANWVASSEEEYLSLAVAAAADILGLAVLRAQLRDRMMASPLADGRSFTRHLETTYSRLWDRHVARRGPRDSVSSGNGKAAVL